MLPFFFSLLFILPALAEDVTCVALVRNSNHSLVKEKVTLSDMTSTTEYIGRYFKIVEAKNENPIKLDDKKLSLRACTAYYHLSKARSYFMENFSDRHVRNLRQLTIRVEMPYSFIDSSHYMDEEFKTYNNSLTIPPSGRNRVSEVPEWDYEIWFAPKKKIKKKTAVEQAAKILNSAGAQESLRLGVLTTTGSTIANHLARGLTITSLEGEMYVQSLLVSMIAVTITPWIIEKSASFVKQTIYLDTVLIPEVIYHEYVHIALAKHLKPTHHSPIIEGMANFYAADIGKTDSILKKTRGYSKGLDKLNANKTIMFDTFMEDRTYAQYGFTFGLLWDIKKALGEKDARKLIYLAHQKLNSASTLRRDLLKALEDAAKEHYSEKEYRRIILTLARVWQNRGL